MNKKKVNICYQRDTMQCGVACLKMLCEYFIGKKISYEFISQHCSISKQGISLLGLSESAKSLGLHSECGMVSIDELVQMSQPCILHWNKNHFVVFCKIDKKKRFCIADPSRGFVKYSIDEFKSHWIVDSNLNGEEAGILLYLEPTKKFYNLVDEAKISRKDSHLFQFLVQYTKGYYNYILQILIGLVISSLLLLLLPFLTQSIVDIGVKNYDLEFIWLVLLGQLVLTVSRATIDFIRRWLLLHVSLRINISLVSDFFIKTLRLPMSFFDTRLVGDFMQRMNDHGRVNSFLTQQMLGITFSLLMFIVFSIVLLLYDRLVFILFLLGCLTYGGWISLFLHRRKSLDYEMFEQQSKYNSKTYEFITSMQEIKLQNCEKRRRWEWEDEQTKLFEIQMKSLKLQQTQEAGGIFINELKNIIITVVAATSVINDQITLGMMLAIQYIIGQLNSPVEQFMNFLYSLQDVKIGLERINEIHRMSDEDNPNMQLSIEDANHGIKVENIVFKYDSHAINNTIDNISLHIPFGKVTAIVGVSGSGKTSLIKLLLGYYPVLSGSITIGSTNIDKINKRWWRTQCGVVMQDGIIFSESIARNIAVDDGEIYVERLEQAAKIANIHDYIMELPLKYSTIIGRDGVGLSQGQKQRILIARAVYKNPDYIFLDEATNSLDANNERTIVENLDKFYKGKTVVIVAHRLSTVKNADQIIVLEQGRVVEVGTHIELSKKYGAYYNLVKNQLELGC